MKNEKGITLMVLVITIIVMIIIAGVTVTVTLGDNGLVEKSKNEVSKYDSEVTRQSVNLAVLSAAKAGNGTITQSNLVKYLDEQIGEGKYTLTSVADPEGFKIIVGTQEFTTTLKGVVTEKNN